MNDALNEELRNTESERAHHAMTAGCLRTDLEYANVAIARLREALSELADLMEDVVTGEYKPDSFTTQPVRAALEASHDATADTQGGE